jgi:hypothetical protein
VITAHDLDQWVEQHRTRLTVQGITATFGETMRADRAAGPTWISFLSRTAEGRVVRRPDGSCEFDANRFKDGAVLMHETRSTTTVADFDAFALVFTDG